MISVEGKAHTHTYVPYKMVIDSVGVECRVTELICPHCNETMELDTDE